MEKTLFENLKGLFLRYRLRFALAFVMVILSNCLLIGVPVFFRYAVYALTHDPDPPATLKLIHSIMGDYIDSLTTWVIILILITTLSAYFKYWMRIEFVTISREAERDIRSQLFERLQMQSRAFFDQYGVGELLSRLTNDLSAYRDLLGPGIMYPLMVVTLLVPGLISLAMISPLLTMISLIPLILIPLVNSLTGEHMYNIATEVQSMLGKMSNLVQEYFSGIRVIKGYVIESKALAKFQELCKKLECINIRSNRLQGLLFPFFTLITRLITVVLVLFSGLIILLAWSDLSVADFISFMWIQSYIFFPVLMLTWVLPVYQRGRAAYARLLEMDQAPIEVKEGSNSDLRVPEKADIDFQNLSFTYPNAERAALSNITLKIKGGSLVGITGPVGSGKSTLLHLLNRDYEIPFEMIKIGNHDIRSYSLKALSEAMIIVEQIPFLFSKNIIENVSFARLDASQEEIEGVMRQADLHDTILEFPEQYKTVVGERGMTLSGGQKQRMAIARAFLVNRPIMLLDDIFSAVDASTEKRIFEAIKANFQDKTLLLVTHRVSILEQMDRVLYMMNGKIVEEGPPNQLKNNAGFYAALVELQSMGLYEQK